FGATSERSNSRHVVSVEGEIEYGKILALPPRVGRSGNDDETLLHVPAQHHLRGCARVLAADSLDGAERQRLAAPKRRVRFQPDPELVMRAAHIALLDVR